MMNSASLPRMQTVVRSHRGLVRKNNEDAVANLGERGLIVLADGMGGYSAGEVAASIAVETILEHVNERLHQRQQQTHSSKVREEPELLRDAIVSAHQAIRNCAAGNPNFSGMGTTVVAALVRPDGLTVAHVGDSRLYRMRNRRLQRLTLDHSLLEELISSGQYTREQAETLVRKNVVTRALGVDTRLDVDVAQHSIRNGDLILLCSDGLTDMVSDTAIEQALLQPAENLEQLADRLIEMALDAGGRDNVSLALAELDMSRDLLADTLMSRLKRLFASEAPPTP